VKTYRAWRKALHRAKTEEPYDPAETARIREELARMMTALQKTAEYERREKEQSGEEGDDAERRKQAQLLVPIGGCKAM
jgi:hypothetical protein